MNVILKNLVKITPDKIVILVYYVVESFDPALDMWVSCVYLESSMESSYPPQAQSVDQRYSRCNSVV